MHTTLRIWIVRICLLLLIVWTAVVVIPLELELGSFDRLSTLHKAALLAAALGSVTVAYGVFRPEPARWLAGGFHRWKIGGLLAGLLAVAVVYAAGYALVNEALQQTWNTYFGRAVPLLLIAGLAFSADALVASVRKPEFWLAMAAVGFSLLLAEFAMRYYVRHILTDTRLQMLYDPASQDTQRIIRYVPHHYLIYVHNPAWNAGQGDDGINTLGYRGPEIEVPKPAGVYRIVAVGGSTTYGTAVPYWQEAYPAQLQDALRDEYGYEQVEVINAGVAGYASWETMINLALNVVDLQPDLVIVYQNTNDVHARIVPTADYRGDNGGRRSIWDFNRVRRSQSLAARLPSVLWRFLGMNFRWFDTSSSIGLEEVTTLPCTGETATESCLGMTPAEALAANPPIYYERNLRSIVGIAQAHGAKVLLLTWAYIPVEGEYTSRPEYQAALDEQNEVMRQLGSELDVSFYDFAADMPPDPAYYADGRHMTAAGNQARADLIARFIDEARLIPAP